MHRLLLLGTGWIAGHHIEEFAKVPGCSIVACVDQLPGRAAAFAAANDIGASFESLEAAIAWGDFDAAINATPDGVHKATTLALLAAGKHVFCEKPLAPNHADALAMTEAAEAAGLVNMVNLTYRNSPAIQEARRLVLAGAIGELRHVEASYKQSWLVSKSWGDWRVEDKWLWRLSTRHGSTGVLGDVGIHILDFATYGAAQDIVSLHADLVTFPKAEGDRIGDYVLDANDSVAMTARLASGALATIIASRYTTGHGNDLSLTLHGTEGALKVETDGKAARLSACLGEDVDVQLWRELALPDVKRNARRFVDALDAGRNGDPSFRRAADIQKLIDAAFESSASRLPISVG
ncbi:Gfo/Idh/MocA family oxidoreductase [Mesorhizobium sp. WSM4310]|uniref:Gfo/Idh/MocA family protein n=1 Tax=unclassified Mesorhizobium TaxID=325217 RepID=UPI000BB097B3|nr:MULTISPECIES: Gfo/Idh/MocA family oxidoreductase [unclassified Mesorhizobium]PBC21570.1 oxidoreductase [Mesorhizobium sp. WSM4311]TRC91104.1 Gfo/Idh/MocA family oxidoreductase [Mesorhizobium sp. WSM4310]TRD01657.1 Gfo/Idh/MocA family oxidoreductase [Mesorhizobium sp. WSM4305]